MLWQQLTKIALLGTENSQLEEASLQRLSEFGVDTHREAPQVLADAAALLTQMRKAGFQLIDYQGDMPTSIAAAQAHSPKAVHLLHLILHGPHGEVLPEYLAILKKSGKVLPVSELPAMMQLDSMPTTWQQVEPLVGEDGRWLLRLHPEWSKLLEDPTQYNWQTGTRQERLKMLAHWRRESPKFAIELLQSTWETESPTDKAAFLTLLQTNLAPSDLAFLEPCLDDKRKEVRQAAAPLLAKIPGSSVRNRMEERAAQVFSFKSNRLQVSIPDEPDTAAERDGLVKLHQEWPGGAKASYLGQVVSRVDPAFWEAFFKKTKVETYLLFEQTDWASTLRQALAWAIVFHQKQDWATPIAEQLLKIPTLDHHALPRLDDLLELMPSADAHRLALHQIAASNDLPNQYSIPYLMLLCHEELWPDELTMLIVNKFRKEIFKDYRQPWQLQHLQLWLKLLALRCSPALFDQLQTGWGSPDAVQWRYWEKAVEEMLARVLFRQELRKELNGRG